MAASWVWTVVLRRPDAMGRCSLAATRQCYRGARRECSPDEMTQCSRDETIQSRANLCFPASKSTPGAKMPHGSLPPTAPWTADCLRRVWETDADWHWKETVETRDRLRLRLQSVLPRHHRLHRRDVEQKVLHRQAGRQQVPPRPPR